MAMMRPLRPRQLTMTVDLTDGVPEWVVDELSSELQQTAYGNFYDYVRTWEVRDSHRKYFDRAFFPIKSPNGIWWMLRGRLNLVRDAGHVHIGIRLRKHSRGWFFGIGRRRELLVHERAHLRFTPKRDSRE